MFKGRTRRRRGPIGGRAKTTRNSHMFHGVAVVPQEDCECAAAQACVGERFLSDDAPPLPLSGCDNPGGCRCKYQHFDDRRTQPRRETDIGLPGREPPNNQRAGVGRRITDG